MCPLNGTRPPPFITFLFSIFLIGYIIFVAGVAVALGLVGVPPMWIAVAVLVLVGVGIAAGTATKRDAPPPVG